MGSYTDYELSLAGNSFDVQQIINDNPRIPSYGEGLFNLLYVTYRKTFRVKQETWYSHEQDLITISKWYPDISFTLLCFGEENEIWAVYVKNGESEKVEPKIIFPESTIKNFNQFPDQLKLF